MWLWKWHHTSDIRNSVHSYKFATMWFILSLCVLLCLSECYSYDYKEGFLQDIDPDWASISGRINQPKCIDIPSNLTLCQNIGYTQMRLPNLLDHDTIEEVRQQSKSWTSLLGVHCHPDTKLFLCSLFTPVCLDRKIYPCRSLCNAVKAGCEQTMLFYNYSWPDMVRCDKFPEDADLCIKPLHNVSTGEIKSSIKFLFVFQITYKDFSLFMLNILST